MSQLSFYSAEANPPVLADLGGLLCGHGQVASFASTAARLSIVVSDQWRARAIAAECAARGVETEQLTSDSGHPLVRTAFRADLIGLATDWHRGAVKAVPPGFRLDGAALRMWLLAGGAPADGSDVARGRGSILLELDPRAPGTHQPLLRAAAVAGLVPVSGESYLIGPRGGGPAVKVSGRKRLTRMFDLVGDPPAGGEPVWPRARTPVVTG